MNFEDQIVDLLLAEALKNLGVKQESIWFWAYSDDDKQWEIILGTDLEEYPDNFPYQEQNIFSAFTVAELGEMLPLYLKRDADKGISFSVETQGLRIYKSYDNKRWIVTVGDIVESDKKEADARAKMLIYLINEKLIRI